MTQEELAALIARYEKGQCTPEEEARLHAWYDTTLGKTDDSLPDGVDTDTFREEVLASVKEKVQDEPSGKTRRLYPSWLRVVAGAASIIVICTFGFYFFNLDRQPEDIAPGGNRATLTLTDGRTIALDTTQSGIIINNEDISYQSGTSLAVISSEDEGRREISLLTLATPRGGQYQITLADGTHVWLNAGSTLKYPSRFTGNTRDIEITGEAYFSVAEDKSKPFNVISKGQRVTVLGTEFNVSAFDDDATVTTTLVKGAVRVEAAGASVSLVPGEQGLLENHTLTKQQADIESAIAWKDGYFRFNGDLAGIMAQVGRWYNVEIVFGEGVDSSMEIMGRVSRDRKLGDILQTLQEIDPDLKFKVEALSKGAMERRLTIMH